jgi:hypothetical protein
MNSTPKAHKNRKAFIGLEPYACWWIAFKVRCETSACYRDET